MVSAGIVLMVLWAVLETGAFIIASIPVAGLALAFAFYHPNGQTLLGFVAASISFTFHPKIYIWKRISEKEIKKKPESKKVDIIKIEKQIDENKIDEISRLLDNRQ